MRLQRFAAAHDWTVVGEATIQKDQLARMYADGVRIALTREEGPFTALVRRDGQTYYVMTSDWAATSRLPATAPPE